MFRHHLLGVLVALGLTAALGAVAPLPASAHATVALVPSQAQTIQFTSTPPSGVDWYTSQRNIPEYFATATAGSGLPVEFAIAPESADVCSIQDVYGEDHPFGPSAGIDFLGGGTCTILADQAGDDTYLPAPRATQSFELERVQTWIDRVRARKGLPGYTPATFFARLKTWQFTSSQTGEVLPFPGQVVAFSVAGRSVCSGITGSDGVATCKATLPRSDLLKLRFTATYAGTDDYLPVSGSAFFLG